jgi:hypothetical protein
MPLPRLRVDRRQSDQMALAGVCGGHAASGHPCRAVVNEPSDPKSARPFSPKAFCRLPSDVRPLGSRNKIRLSLPRVQRPRGTWIAPRPDPQNVWARSDLRGKKLKAKPGDDLCEPGPGVRPLRPANATAVGRGGRGPGLKPIVGRRRDKFKVRQPPELRGREYPAARGRSVDAHLGKGNVGVRPLSRERNGRSSDPRTDRARIAVELV